MPAAPASPDLARWVDDALSTTPVYDLHTHLYPPSFGPLMLWGIDELLTYHYLVGEAIRASGVAYDAFWKLEQARRAEFIACLDAATLGAVLQRARTLLSNEES